MYLCAKLGTDSLGVYFPACPLIVCAFPNLFSWLWEATSLAPNGWLLGLLLWPVVHTLITEINICDQHRSLNYLFISSKLKIIHRRNKTLFSAKWIIKVVKSSSITLTRKIRRRVFLYIFTNNTFIDGFLPFSWYHIYKNKILGRRNWKYYSDLWKPINNGDLVRFFLSALRGCIYATQCDHRGNRLPYTD